VPQRWSSGDLEIYLLKKDGFKVKFGVICHGCDHHQLIRDNFREGPTGDDAWPLIGKTS
jgi:hypothetical protein